ncbi:MAG: hypothetical protein HGA44_10685 [Cellulomonadaceae bacterium]|nr:hypothetical protein [Cellulomonadaceae bacterium]
MLAAMSEVFGIDEPDLVAALASVRDMLHRGQVEVDALNARLALLTEQIASLREMEAGFVAFLATLAPPSPTGAEAEAEPDGPARDIQHPAARPERQLLSANSESQISRVKSVFVEHPDRTWRAQEVADLVGSTGTKAQLDTVRTNIHRLVQRGEITAVGRGLFRWGGASTTDSCAS